MIDLHNVKREVIIRHNTSLINALEEFMDEKKPYLITMGTDGLSDPTKMKESGGVVLGSVTVNLAKQMLYPLLVVKPSRACQLLRHADGATEPISVMMQVSGLPSASPALPPLREASPARRAPSRLSGLAGGSFSPDHFRVHDHIAQQGTGRSILVCQALGARQRRG